MSSINIIANLQNEITLYTFKVETSITIVTLILPISQPKTMHKASIYHAENVKCAVN